MDDTVAGNRSQSVGLGTDWQLWVALGLGALALYSRASQPPPGSGTTAAVVLIDWITAGDDRVCPSCLDNEDNSPYPPDQVPSYPGHPRCRCYLDSEDANMSARLMAYYFG